MEAKELPFPEPFYQFPFILPIAYPICFHLFPISSIHRKFLKSTLPMTEKGASLGKYIARLRDGLFIIRSSYLILSFWTAASLNLNKLDELLYVYELDLLVCCEIL